MELTGIINDVDITNKAIISIEINEKNYLYSDEFEKLLNSKKLSIDIKKFRNKRSKDANAYCWKLCTEIGNVLCKSKEEIYLDMLKSYGQSNLILIRSDIDVSCYFKYYEPTGTKKGFTYYKVYKGSSEYDSKEMYILIEGIQEECRNLGIPTLDDLKIQQMVEEWGEKIE